MVLAQYYNFVRFGHDGYRYIMETMSRTRARWRSRSPAWAPFRLVGEPGAEQLPLVAFQLAEERDYDEFDIASQLAAERGWMVPAYTLPPNAEHVTIMRALVKLTLGHALANTLADDIAQACETLEHKGGLHESTASASRPAPATEDGAHELRQRPRTRRPIRRLHARPGDGLVPVPLEPVLAAAGDPRVVDLQQPAGTRLRQLDHPHRRVLRAAVDDGHLRDDVGSRPIGCPGPDRWWVAFAFLLDILTYAGGRALRR